MLLGPRFHGVFPDHAVADLLDRHFLMHDFTPAALRKGLQVWKSPIPKPQHSRSGFATGTCSPAAQAFAAKGIR